MSRPATPSIHLFSSRARTAYPPNPFIKAGAIVVTDRLLSLTGNAAGAVRELMRRESGNASVDTDHRVAASELGRGHRNASLARFLASNGLGADGTLVLSPAQTKRVNAVMLTCGTYDAAGEFAYRVGLPGRAASAAASWPWFPTSVQSVCGAQAWGGPGTQWQVWLHWMNSLPVPAGRCSRTLFVTPHYPALPGVSGPLKRVTAPPYSFFMAIQDIYPTALRLLGRPVLVVGGGPVAARRAKGLLDAGAKVTVVAPVASEKLRALVDSGLLAWEPREYRTEDLDGVWFVQTATGTAAVDTRVAADAEAQRIWCVNASDHEASAAWTPAVAEVDDVKIAINAGGDPRRAMALRDAVATALETGDLPLRRHRKPEDKGSVALIGGGPGDSGLITVRGRRLLGQADVVVADRLGPRELLKELAPDVRIIEVGKTPGHHPVPQLEINRILVEEALKGNRVVRLKGGDPYVLGRGGEEAEFCRQNGVGVEVVSGVTSAISVPAAAGIPVTHRGLAKGFSVVTGHEELSEVPARPDHTVVLLMGVAQLRDSAAALAASGLPLDTPVGIVEKGYLPEQRVTIGTLGTIADQAEAVGVANPAVIVIGDVVRVSPFAPEHFKTADYSTITPNRPRVRTN
ncbi:multifunctional uroporphyrinogen III methylaseprecorrin-2 oxidaseferrochelatase [Arthrobacter sp. ZXY-2]|nr:multifunctional uroporphyrinogen III methylaseprecorrin-2 oxidaseferrochelatase [Arthrobacter sp. ZXY-2]